MSRGFGNPFLATGPFAPADDEVRSLLLEAARTRRALSYSEMLHRLGQRFTRPKMRVLLHAIEQVDRAGMARGEPELAVLVVRATDGLPGEGWWTHHARALGYDGPATGPDAANFIHGRQKLAFDHWDPQ